MGPPPDFSIVLPAHGNIAPMCAALASLTVITQMDFPRSPLAWRIFLP